MFCIEVTTENEWQRSCRSLRRMFVAIGRELRGSPHKLMEHYKSVGFIKRNDDAYAVYLATLQTGHPDITTGLTLSIGKWWEDTALDERHWICHTVRLSENFHMRIEKPTGSPHINFKPLGIALSRESALTSDLKDEIFAVADYIAVDSRELVFDGPRSQHSRKNLQTLT